MSSSNFLMLMWHCLLLQAFYPPQVLQGVLARLARVDFRCARAHAAMWADQERQPQHSLLMRFVYCTRVRSAACHACH